MMIYRNAYICIRRNKASLSQPLLLAKRYFVACINELQATLRRTTVLNMNRQKNDIKANRTFSTFGFARHTSQRFAKPKELNFANAPTDNKK